MKSRELNVVCRVSKTRKLGVEDDKMEDRCMELIVRGVCVREKQLLLCRNKEKGHLFLPGGHIEGGEGAVEALVREIREEAGYTCTVGRFLGAAETRFSQDGITVCELNLVFALQLNDDGTTSPPPSAESHIEFVWQPLDDVPTTMLPPVLAARIQGWVDGTDRDCFISMSD